MGSAFSFVSGGSSSTTGGYASSAASAFAFTNSNYAAPTNGHGALGGSAFSFIQGPTAAGIAEISKQSAGGAGIENLDLGSLYAAAAEPAQTRSIPTSNYSALNPGLSTDMATKHFDIGVRDTGAKAT